MNRTTVCVLKICKSCRPSENHEAKIGCTQKIKGVYSMDRKQSIRSHCMSTDWGCWQEERVLAEERVLTGRKVYIHSLGSAENQRLDFHSAQKSKHWWVSVEDRMLAGRKGAGRKKGCRQEEKMLAWRKGAGRKKGCRQREGCRHAVLSLWIL